MRTAPVFQMAGMYLNPGLNQVYSRILEYLSHSQLIRRLQRNTEDDDTYQEIYRQIRSYATKTGRKTPFEQQAFQVFAGKIPDTLEIHCYDARADHPIHPPITPYIVIRCRIVNGRISSFKDAVKK